MVPQCCNLVSQMADIQQGRENPRVKTNIRYPSIHSRTKKDLFFSLHKRLILGIFLNHLLRPRPSFSFSAYDLSSALILKSGKPFDNFLMCRAKKPLFRDISCGYPPLISSVLAFADSKVTASCRGRPVKPGLVQPPPVRGEGDRDNDMPGVPETVLSASNC